MKKEELVGWERRFYQLWNQGLHAESDIERANKAHKQIVALIKKQQVTEEWIEEKATKLREINIESEKGSLSLVFLTQPQAEDFIRSLVEEIRK